MSKTSSSQRLLRLVTVTSQDDPRKLVESLRGEMIIPPEVLEGAATILRGVKERGDAALTEYTERFDGVKLTPADLHITRHQMQLAANSLPQEQISALVAARDNIEGFHNRQGYAPFQYRDVTGSQVGQKVLSLQRVGVYAPGGTAAYPSSVLMCALPAKVAGVEEIYVTSPLHSRSARRDATLTAAYLAGVSAVFPIGGAQAVAALTYGTETVPKVDKIVGPGNLWVTAAKMLVYGKVGLDMIAGPSEVLILADESARADYIAADLLSQAEHDAASAVYLVTTSLELIDRVQEELEAQLARLPRQEIARKSLEANGVAFLVGSKDRAIEMANAVAPEHLEILTANPQEYFRHIKFAGACFLGPYSPEAVGDYLVGPNHVLPTSGSARYFSGLSTYDFQRRINYIQLTREGFAYIAGHTVALAELEGLQGHAESVKLRMGQE